MNNQKKPFFGTIFHKDRVALVCFQYAKIFAIAADTRARGTNVKTGPKNIVAPAKTLGKFLITRAVGFLVGAPPFSVKKRVL